MWKKDSKGASAMHLAAAKGNLAIVEALIKEALPWMIRTKDLIDNKGLTPFHYAGMMAYNSLGSAHQIYSKRRTQASD